MRSALTSRRSSIIAGESCERRSQRIDIALLGREPRTGRRRVALDAGAPRLERGDRLHFALDGIELPLRLLQRPPVGGGHRRAKGGRVGEIEGALRPRDGAGAQQQDQGSGVSHVASCARRATAQARIALPDSRAAVSAASMIALLSRRPAMAARIAAR